MLSHEYYNTLQLPVLLRPLFIVLHYLFVHLCNIFPSSTRVTTNGSNIVNLEDVAAITGTVIHPSGRDKDLDVKQPNNNNNELHDNDDATITEFDDYDDTTNTEVLESEEVDSFEYEIIIQETKKKCFTIDDFHRHTILGEGQFGQVWLVSEKVATRSTANSTTSECHSKSITSTSTTTGTYALKVVSKYDVVINDEVDMIVRERDIMQQLHSHPCITQLHGTFQNNHFLFLLLEFCQGGELYSRMHSKDTDHPNAVGGGQQQQRRRQRLPEYQVAFYTVCIADALEYMHIRHHIVYRDLKPENILFDATTGYPKLIDMGYAKVLTDTMEYRTHTFCGTPNYIAPEMIQHHTETGCSFHVDHWALGIVIHEMLFATHPFNNSENDMDQMELFDSICHASFTIPKNDHDAVSSDAIHLMTQLLMKDPNQRIGRTMMMGGNSGSVGQSICDHSFVTTHFNTAQIRNQSIRAPWIPNIQNAFDATSFDPSIHTIDDRFVQKYPKLTKREAALFDAF